jgi:hypothetical protein
MPNSPIESYLEARNKLDVAARNAEDLMKLIRQAGHANWKQLMVSNCPGAGFPPEIAMARGIPTIDARTWPTGQGIADVLMAWHAANHAVKNAWDQVPPDRQSGLLPPA